MCTKKEEENTTKATIRIKKIIVVVSEVDEGVHVDLYSSLKEVNNNNPIKSVFVSHEQSERSHGQFDDDKPTYFKTFEAAVCYSDTDSSPFFSIRHIVNFNDFYYVTAHINCESCCYCDELGREGIGKVKGTRHLVFGPHKANRDVDPTVDEILACMM